VPRPNTYWIGEQVIWLIAEFPFSKAIFCIIEGNLDFNIDITAFIIVLSTPLPYILIVND
jgi:hypothetical protein